MATPNTDNIGVLEALVTGAIFVAPTTTALPTDATSALSADYKCLGFTSDDGIVITESGSTKSLRVWEGKLEVANRRTEYTEQVKFTSVENNMEVAKVTWGADHVSGDSDAWHIQHHGGDLDPIHVVIECVPMSGFVSRYCMKAQLTNRGDLNGNGQDFSGRELTFNCLGRSGVTMDEYVAKVASETTTTTTTGTD